MIEIRVLSTRTMAGIARVDMLLHGNAACGRQSPLYYGEACL